MGKVSSYKRRRYQKIICSPEKLICGGEGNDSVSAYFLFKIKINCLNKKNAKFLLFLYQLLFQSGV